ncbi:Dinucleoside triphosphate hydrolase [Coemansia nantahalensis]|uniref:Dinucleoside triphosphate hydrolase n=2 Tax=Coemansia TaxID=4863 RepID=A0ACC1LGZ7_9FUNG|nr:Dinucleoside triphosphate hydrolase [Coemansia nantahalensis]KAJ2766036.1 Dinucleoside triphosphate hydrolase [Coemansia nantahalensis]KAJ2807559.1 Dinucleoside triphosphate hydrolase [Coemansia helicoidea]
MEKTLRFGPIAVPLSQAFFASKHAFGLVNLKPIRPGHVLVVSRRPARRFAELTPDEVADLFVQGQRVSRTIERLHRAEALTLCIQDGAAAGQTVPHVHLHVIPRRPGDFADNDDVYRELDATGRQPRVDNPECTPRTPADMAAEALVLRAELGGWDDSSVC